MQNDDVKRDEAEAPFFARFLEGQEFPRVQTDVKAGKKGGGGGGGEPIWPPVVTLKYPSDDDDDPVVIS